MNDPLASLPLDRPVVVQFADGVVLRGIAQACGGGWLQLDDQRGRHWVQLTQVAMVSLEHHAPAGDDAPPSSVGSRTATAAAAGLAKPKAVAAPARVTAAPGRAWQEDDLRTLSDAFLEGATDSECAQRFRRTRTQITLLRQGFEAARGAIDEERIPAVAQTWVARWRRILAG